MPVRHRAALRLAWSLADALAPGMVSATGLVGRRFRIDAPGRSATRRADHVDSHGYALHLRRALLCLSLAVPLAANRPARRGFRNGNIGPLILFKNHAQHFRSSLPD